jgi:DNA-binding MarR family transcriptional regulator
MAVDATGTRVTELAERTKMTKQAVGELVSYLTQHGYVSIAPDATDRRAKQILLTARGWEAIEVASASSLTLIDGWTLPSAPSASPSSEKR